MLEMLEFLPLLLLRDVLFVPRFSFNLISVSCLMKDENLSINFSGNSCVIQDKLHSTKIGRAECSNGLYLLAPPDKSLLTYQTHVVVHAVSLDAWHNRLGHLSHMSLNSMKNALHVSSNMSDHSICHTCPLAKQRRMSFPFNNKVVAAVFDLVHCVIWCPFKTPTYARYRYFLTLVDDCSRYTSTYLMRNKFDAETIVPCFFQLVLTQFSKTIKVFRSDKAHELQFKEFFASKGTVH